MANTFGTLVSLGFGLVLSVLLGELFVRILLGAPMLPVVPPMVVALERPRLIPSETRVFQLAPAQPWHSINAASIRDYDYATAKPAGTFRIIVLGDSYAYGQGVRLDDTFSKRLERKLNAEAPSSFEVINLGVVGYNTVQELAYLKEAGLGYDPNLVVLAYILNDYMPTVRPEEIEAVRNSRLAQLLMFLEPPPHFMETVGRFYLAQLLYGYYDRGRTEILVRLRDQASQAVVGPESPPSDPADPYADWAESRAALREIAGLTRARGASLVVAIFPWMDGQADPYPNAHLHAMIAQTVVEAGGRALDLQPAFKDDIGPGIWASPTDHHPNAQGHEIAAEAIYRFLTEQRLVPTGPAIPTQAAGGSNR